MREVFHRFSTKTSLAMGTPAAFILALSLIIGWLFTGPLFDFSNTWQLIINTTTTIVTFLMVFLIQNTQNRDSKALHLKIDELVKVSKGARNSFINIEEFSDQEIAQIEAEFKKVSDQYLTAKKNTYIK